MAAQTHPDVRAIAQKVDSHYNKLQSLQADFEEHYSGAGINRRESGVMWMRKPGKMRWEYKSPREKVFLTDGKVAWFYVPGERQARRTQIKNLDDLRSPLRFLLGRTRLEKELKGLSWAPDVHPLVSGDVVLRGVPAGMEDRVSQVILEADPDGRIRRILMEELDGSTTDFRLNNERANAAVADAQFRFQPPAGVEVMERQELEP